MPEKESAMNGFEIPAEVLSRTKERRGHEHPFADLDPVRTALVVVDMQNGFMDDEVGHAVCPMAREIVPNVNRLAVAVRSSGGGVFWVKNTFNARTAREWSVLEEMATPERRAKRAASMSEGTKGHALWPLLDVRPEDEIVQKYRFSAFLPGASNLHERLQERGFDTALITGTVTNVCCESSARDAMMMNYKVVMVTDANAAMTMEEHRASLLSFYSIFGDVMDTDFLISRLCRSEVKAA
jgi:nicotinamidase-related amidase